MYKQQKIFLLLTGSSGSGKSTLVKILPRVLGNIYKKEWSNVQICTIAMNICHLFCFLLLSIIFKLKYAINCIVGNYYFTIHFTNKRLFRKIIKLMIILDIFSIPVLSYLKLFFCKVKCKQKKYCLIIFDEYLINILVDYMYFSIIYNAMSIYKYLYIILYSILMKQIIQANTIIVYTKLPLWESIKGWQKREKTIIVDVLQLYERLYATKLFIDLLIEGDKTCQITVLSINGSSPQEIVIKTLQNIIELFKKYMDVFNNDDIMVNCHKCQI